MRRLLTVLVGLLTLAGAGAANAADRGRAEAEESAEIAGYTISKVQRWLHEVALKKIEPGTGLCHPDGNFNYQDAWQGG